MSHVILQRIFVRIRKEDFAQCKKEVMAWEGHCWEVINRQGKELTLDPFYARNELLTEDVVTAMILCHEDNLKTEIKKYAGYHYKAQGIGDTTGLTSEYMQSILKPTGWDKLPYDQQFAIVQGIDQICQKYRDDEPEPPFVPVPAYDSPAFYC